MNVFLEIGLILLYFLIFTIIIQRHSYFRIPALPKYFLSGVFILKIMAGIILAMIYTYYYPNRLEADIFKYFDDSKVMYDALHKNPEDFFRMLSGMYGGNDHHFMHTYYYEMNNWYREYEGETFNDSHTIIRFNALLRVFSFGIYHVHTVFVCFLVMIGLVASYKTFVKWFSGKEFILALVIFLLPSVVFWGSGVLKEGLLLFGLGLFIYSIFEIAQGKIKWYFFMLASFSFFILLFLKIYSLLLLLPVIVAFWINLKTKIKFQFITYSICFVLALLTAVNIKYIKPELDILQVITAKQHDFINHAKELNSSSRVEIDPIEPNLISFALHAPEALFHAFFRPFILESAQPFMILAGIENLILLGLLVLVFIKREKLTREQKNLFYLLICYSLFMLILVGMVTPVLGAMVRYKVPALGMLAAAFILAADWKSIFNNYPKLKKVLKLDN